jgi:alcohol dehydrogenase (cytochrome c)
MSKRNWKSTVLSVPVVLVAAGAYAQQPQATDVTKNLTPVTDTMLRDPPAADWLMWRRTYNGWGYSPLDQINKGNVKNLQTAWTWSMTTGATEITPIVHDGVLFLYNAADKIQALNGATGDLIWEYKRDLPAKLLTEPSNALAKLSPSATLRSTTTR